MTRTKYFRITGFGSFEGDELPSYDGAYYVYTTQSTRDGRFLSNIRHAFSYGQIDPDCLEVGQVICETTTVEAV